MAAYAEPSLAKVAGIFLLDSAPSDYLFPIAATAMNWLQSTIASVKLYSETDVPSVVPISVNYFPHR